MSAAATNSAMEEKKDLRRDADCDCKDTIFTVGWSAFPRKTPSDRLFAACARDDLEEFKKEMWVALMSKTAPEEKLSLVESMDRKYNLYLDMLRTAAVWHSISILKYIFWSIPFSKADLSEAIQDARLCDYKCIEQRFSKWGAEMAGNRCGERIEQKFLKLKAEMAGNRCYCWNDQEKSERRCSVCAKSR